MYILLNLTALGWHPITLLNKNAHPLLSGINSIHPLHWHGETFDIPENAQRIANSQGCKNQAFIYNKHIIALQFHLELSPQGAKKIITQCKYELSESGRYIQDAKTIMSQVPLFTQAQHTMQQLLDNIVKL